MSTMGIATFSGLNLFSFIYSFLKLEEKSVTVETILEYIFEVRF